MALKPDTFGVKGSLCYSEEVVGDIRMSLFSRLVRGATDIKYLIRSAFCEEPEDTVVMAFQTRDIRGGKGERTLFHTMMKEILTKQPSLAKHLLPLVPVYGRWDDVWKIGAASEAVDEVVLEQFRYDQESENPSLLAKWLPREGKPMAKHFADLLFPLVPAENGQRMRSYRKTVAFLNRALETVEIKMCGKAWASIRPGSVPGQLMSRNRAAFMNHVGKCGSDDRVKCADQFRAFIDDVMDGKKKINGGQTTMPHEHIRNIIRLETNQDIDNVTEAQWRAIVDETKKEGGLGRAVFMCDFSGSMEGVPKDVSLGLGILGSQVCTMPGFRNRILTFDYEPKWHEFQENATLREKVASIGRLGVGTNTNFLKACMLVLEGVVGGGQCPTHMIVITDMGFDAAAGDDSKSWATQFQIVRKAFADAGYEAPVIVNWNVSASYKDAHATANEVGVVELSGWSPSLLKVLQGGLQVVTPMEGLRKTLDNKRYDLVRRALEAAKA